MAQLQQLAAYMPEDLSLWFYTFIGAFTLYVLNRLQKKQPFSLFTALNVGINDGARARVVLTDMLISSLLGTIVVFPLVSPSTIPQALVAGLGMTGILSAHTTQLGG